MTFAWRYLAAAALVWIAGLAAAEERIALVIGNSQYDHLISLKNPVNDATDISAALEAQDFDVYLGTDLDRRGMEALIDRFVAAAETADVRLFYFAGHGFQIDARNQLVPVDAVLTGPDDVADQTLTLDSILGRLEGFGGTNLVFLDACRDNPLGAPGGNPLTDGLARVGSAANFLFAFATQPDAVAYDGIRRNSFFTEAILSHIHTPGQDISDMMISVRRDVIAATGGLQVPWENSSLTQDFHFDPSPEAASPETLLWQVAAQEGDAALMRLYLDRYPQGAHVSDILAFLGEGRAPEGATRNLPAAPEPTANEKGDRLWALAQRSRMRALVALYLEQYPKGTHTAAAERLLATLPAAEETVPAQLCARLATHPRDATANTAGIPFSQLQRNATAAIDACGAAAAAYPDLPHYTALLARAKAAAGARDEAIALYRDAAERGDLRAMVSLALILETGDGLPSDPSAALALYEEAAAGGSADAAINLAVALFDGTAVERDVPRAVGLLRRAAAGGSAIATFNLGVLAQDGVADTPGAAIAHFRKAARDGEPRGFLAAAILLDEGRGVTADPRAAADLLLRGVAADSGEALAQLSGQTGDWTRDTVLSVQRRLQDAGLYDGPLDGAGNDRFTAALESWRNGGYAANVLGG